MRASMIVAVLALAGCSSAMKVESANTESVTIFHAQGYKDAADKEAEKQCGNFGKRSKFRNVREDSGRSWAIYDCVT